MSERTCTIPECEKPRRYNGYCRLHNWRWKRHGDPLAGRTPNGTPMSWLRQERPPTDDCVVWPFPNRRTGGYARVKVDGVDTLVTHIVLTLDGRPQPDPPNNLALHSCDNPPCVNPRHLRWGSHADNARDKVSRGRHKRRP